MKKNPIIAAIETGMHQGPLASHGFLGEDERSLDDIIRQDAVFVDRLGLTCEQIGRYLQRFTAEGERHLGGTVLVDNMYQVSVEEHKGSIPCPFRDNYIAKKQLTTLTNTVTSETIRWSDLSAHMIREHGFFQGRGARYRLEPSDVASIFRLHKDAMGGDNNGGHH